MDIYTEAEAVVSNSMVVRVSVLFPSILRLRFLLMHTSSTLWVGELTCSCVTAA